MLPLGDKPILQYIVDELKTAGLEDILIVSREKKPGIARYFAGISGVSVLEKRKARGPGHSVLVAREFAGGENFLVAFGDAPFLGNPGKSFLPKMTAFHDSEQAAAVMAVDEIPVYDIHLRAIVSLTGIPVRGAPIAVSHIMQKPTRQEAKSRWAVTGRYTFSSAVFDALSAISSSITGELLLVDAIQHMLTEGRGVYAIPLDEGLRRFDTGSIEGYVEAFRAFTS